jgi:DeoR family transcriptional regulator, aga operon transcriptional repressor
MSTAKVARFGVILGKLSAGEVVAVDDLARDLDVSGATIRRDLRDLARQSLLTRVHGGAVAREVPYELPVRDRSAQRVEEKRRIGVAAAALVPDGAVVGLNGGTTTTEVARALAARSGLTIVTNALNIAVELSARPDIRIMVTGGQVRSASIEMVGPVADRTISEFNLDIVFLGMDGIQAKAGCTTHDVTEARTDAALVGQGEKVIAVADGTKIGRAVFASICPLAAVDLLVTDVNAGRDELDRLADSGLEVMEV